MAISWPKRPDGAKKAFAADISHLSNLKPPSYPGKLPDSSGNDLARRDSGLSDCSNAPILPLTVSKTLERLQLVRRPL